MKLSIKSNPSRTPTCDCIVLPIFDTKQLARQLSGLPKDIEKVAKNLVTDTDLNGKLKHHTLVYLGTASKKLLLIGLGEKKSCSVQDIRNAFGVVARVVRKTKAKNIGIIADPLQACPVALTDRFQAIAEGLVLGAYQFKRYKTEKEDAENHNVKSVDLLSDTTTKSVKDALRKGQILGESANISRSLANTPANDLTPKDVVAFVKQTFKNTTIKLDILDKTQAKKLKMNAFLGVAQGSNNDPYVVIMRHQPKKGQAPLTFVGKGVTFDSGGISIKPSLRMGEMKGDMSGAAAVVGAMNAITQLNPNRNITGIIPLVENMPSGTAQRPGDVVTAMNGKTIEILNTDAEGRLILADAITYAARKEKASAIVDIATLTGACGVALGELAAGIMGNNQSMIDQFLEIGEFSGDRLWQLPLFDGYIDYLKSATADIAHCSEGRLGGTITAAKFLEQFTDDIDWVHLDIASMMMARKNSGYIVKGMSGVGARNLAEFALRYKG